MFPPRRNENTNLKLTNSKMSEFERVRGSSKAFLVVTLFIFIFYKFIVMVRLIKTKGDQEVTH